jgi:hypothetical protein
MIMHILVEDAIVFGLKTMALIRRYWHGSKLACFGQTIGILLPGEGVRGHHGMRI